MWFAPLTRIALYATVMVVVAGAAGSCSRFTDAQGRPLPTRNDYRHLARRIVYEVVSLRKSLPFMAALDPARAIQDSPDQVNLQLRYEAGKTQAPNPRWMPGDATPKTIHHYTRQGVFVDLIMSLDVPADTRTARPGRIGDLTLVLTTDGPKGPHARWEIEKIIDHHRSEFARRYAIEQSSPDMQDRPGDG